MQTFYYTVGVDEMKSYIPNVPILLPASSYARRGLKRPTIPTHIIQKAADSGGFVATFKWGDYRYTPDQYVEWLYTWHPEWSAMMDYCCEDESLNGRFAIVQERQQKTTDMAWHL